MANRKVTHPTIDKWSLVDAFGGIHLEGVITGHRRPSINRNGDSISATSDIVGRRKGRVVTLSGTEYRLGLSNDITHLKIIRNLPEV